LYQDKKKACGSIALIEAEILFFGAVQRSRKKIAAKAGTSYNSTKFLNEQF
jgi:hypothetical protein